MKKKITIFKGALTLSILVAFISPKFLRAQEVLYEENFGTPPSNILIGNYTGWQDTIVTYIGNGTCDVRASSASMGYGGASGGGNVLINDTIKWFQISGINTLLPQSILQQGDSDLRLYCGIRKTIKENGNTLILQYSLDSLIWHSLQLQDTLPVGTGTSGWYRVCYPNLPMSDNLHLRFSNSTQSEYRVDDIKIVNGEEVVLETVAKPSVNILGGTYHEPQIVSLDCSTSQATIHYTFDGTDPDETSNEYLGPLTINNTCVLKAIATKQGMYNSEVLTVNYTILDTNAMVFLPFDISDNSDNEKKEIKVLPGFKSRKLGTSYADGAAKFESKNAGSAMLMVHMDSMPDSLYFDIQGRKAGTPATFQEVRLLVSESEDGELWTDVAEYSDDVILTEDYKHIGGVKLSYKTRFVRWKLVSATSGNLQLNNIKITKLDSEPDDEVGIAEIILKKRCSIYPNPVKSQFSINSNSELEKIELYGCSGKLMRVWNNVVKEQNYNVSDLKTGCYFLKVKCKDYEDFVKMLIMR